MLIAWSIPPLVYRPDGRGLHDIAAGTATVTLQASGPARLGFTVRRRRHPGGLHARPSVHSAPVLTGALAVARARRLARGLRLRRLRQLQAADAPSSSTASDATPSADPTASDSPATRTTGDEVAVADFVARIRKGLEATDTAHMDVTMSGTGGEMTAEGDVDYTAHAARRWR